MENFKIESRYLKLCNKFRAVIRCASFCRPDYQKLLMCPLIKTLGLAFETLGQAFKTLGRAFEGLREN